MNDYQPPRNRQTTNRPLSGMQILFASILAIGLLLAINFSNRITAGQRIQADRDALEMEIVLLEAERETLRQELEYARSDEYVEAWARSEGKMVRTGEVLVVPVPAGNPIATPEVAVQAPALLFADEDDAIIEPWLVWWALFFDTDPPF